MLTVLSRPDAIAGSNQLPFLYGQCVWPIIWRRGSAFPLRSDFAVDGRDVAFVRKQTFDDFKIGPATFAFFLAEMVIAG